MTKALTWLKANAPGFSNLSEEEQAAISDFALLWGLFESRMLNTNASTRAICAAVDAWNNIGGLEPELFAVELAYFRQRYHPNGDFSPHFDGLHLRRADSKAMVRAVLNGSDDDLRHRTAAALIIVFRYRNNLFHGLKWEYELADQLDNFNAANSILMKALDRYGVR